MNSPTNVTPLRDAAQHAAPHCDAPQRNATSKCDCGTPTDRADRWFGNHGPGCASLGATVAERHAALRRMEYRALDAQADMIDYVAIHHYRNWLEQRIPHRIPVFDSLNERDQTTLARGWEDDMDRGVNRAEQALGGPVHDREMYADAASNRNLE